MMEEAEKQKAIRALFPSIAGVLEGEDWQSSPAGSESGEVGGTLRGWGGMRESSVQQQPPQAAGG